MKKITQILTIFISLSVFGQKDFVTKVTYSERLNFDIPIKKTSELFFNNTNSYYVEIKSVKTIEKSDLKIKKYGKKNNDEIINVNLDKDSIFMWTSVIENKFLVHEKIKKIPWKIYRNETSTILGLKATKATAYFRGRIYTVWFTEEIPVKFGPWKLQGLPGLILEVKDNLDEIFFIAEKIEYSKKNKSEFNLMNENRNYKKINLKEYSKKRNEEIQKQTQKIISKLPRSSKIINMKSKKYKGIELKYEWEKE